MTNPDAKQPCSCSCHSHQSCLWLVCTLRPDPPPEGQNTVWNDPELIHTRVWHTPLRGRDVTVCVLEREREREGIQWNYEIKTKTDINLSARAILIWQKVSAWCSFFTWTNVATLTLTVHSWTSYPERFLSFLCRISCKITHEHENLCMFRS